MTTVCGQCVEEMTPERVMFDRCPNCGNLCFVCSAKVDQEKRERVREVIEMCEAASRDERLADGMLYRKAAELLKEGWGL